MPGGGYAGLHLASQLSKAGVPFTLVEPKEYFHHCVAALRAAVNPGALGTIDHLKDLTTILLQITCPRLPFL